MYQCGYTPNQAKEDYTECMCACNPDNFPSVIFSSIVSKPLIPTIVANCLNDADKQDPMASRSNTTTDKERQYMLEAASRLAIGRYLHQFEYKRVIFNNPATIVMWKDGTKTIVKCGKNDIFDPEKGLALCFMKKAINNDKLYKKILRDGCKDYEPAKEPCLLPSIEGASKIVQDFFSMLNFLGGQE